MQQLSLVFEPGIASRSRSLREHLAVRWHAYGLGKVAIIIDSSPSHCTEKMAGVDSSGKKRCITVDDLEAYMAATGDVSPIHYLADKFMRDPKLIQQEALAQLLEIGKLLPGLIANSGLGPELSKPRRTGR